MSRLFLLLTLALFSCKKEVYEYPLILTGDVTNITSEGADFHARITNVSNENILEYGFVWGTSKMPDLNSSRVVISENKNGTLSERITNDLAPGAMYYVRAFARNSKYTTYGRQVTFLSLGSTESSIQDFYPKQGAGGTRVVILGDNFSGSINNNEVKFGKAIAKVDSASKNRLAVTLPADLAISGMVKITVKTAAYKAISSEYFYLDGVTIHEVNPLTVIGGDKITIRAENHDGQVAGNSLMIGGIAAQIISVENEFITAIVPFNALAGENEVALTTNNKTCYSNDVLTVKNPWGKIPSLNWFSREGAMAFSIGNFGYYGLGDGHGDIWAFNSANNSWVQKSDFPGGKRQYAIGFSIGNRGFAGLGDTQDSLFTDLYQYNPENDSWTRKSDFPGLPRWEGFCLAIGNKAYYGLGYAMLENQYIQLKDFWEYDPLTDKWTRVADFPGNANNGIAGFSIGEKGYAGLGRDESNYVGSRKFWEFNPASNEWKMIADFPGKLRRFTNNFSFIDYGIISMGQELGEEYSILNDAWRYDADDNLWVRVADIPYPTRFENTSFVIGSLGYTCSGIEGGLLTFNPKGN